MAEFTPYRNVPNAIPSPTLGGNYNIDAYWNGINQMKYKRLVDAKNREIENRKAFKENYDPKQLYPKELYEPTKDLVRQRIDEYVARQAELEANGINPQSNRELSNELARARFDILEMNMQGKQIQEKIEAAGKKMEANQGAYSLPEYMKILEEAKAIEDPAKKSSFLDNKFSEFFDTGFDEYSYAEEVLPKPDQEGRVTEISRDKFISGVQNRLLFEKPEVIERAIKKANKVPGTISEENKIGDLANWIVQQNEDEIYRKVAPAKSSSSNKNDSQSRNYGAGGYKTVTIAAESKYPTSNGLADTVNASGLKPQFYDNGKGGTVLLGNSVNAYVDQNGKWRIQGYSQKIVGQEPIDPNVDEYEQKIAVATKYGVDPEKVLVEGGNLVAYGQGALADVPMDLNKSAWEAATGGANFENVVKGYNENTDKEANKSRAEGYQKDRKEAVIKENEDYLRRLKALDPNSEITDAGVSKKVSEAIKRVEELIEKEGGSSQQTKKETPAERAARIAKGG
jgi:hypothetical protein